MSEKQFESFIEEILDIKRLLILALLNNKIENGTIAKTLGVSEGRVSQIMSPGKYKKGRNKNDATGKK